MTTTFTLRKANYLNNRDLLAEIHRSKCSFSSFTKPEYHQHDIIVSKLSDITTEILETAKQNRAKRKGIEAFILARTNGNKTVKLSELTPPTSSIPDQDLIIRVMTFEHIPLAPGRKKTTKTAADRHDKVNFPPFQHWKYDELDQLICVGKSHWQGSVDSGTFSKDHGRISENLGMMFLKLADRYAQRSNWRGYTYVSEMKGQAILQLTQIGLQFDESKSENPFSYYTAAVTNSFTRVLNIEKKNQNIRDDLLEVAGLAPSLTRQYQAEFAEEIAKQAEFYKNIRLPKSEEILEGAEDFEEETAESEDSDTIIDNLTD